MKAAASHILVKTREQALELKGQIKSPADFAKAAAQHSTCPSGKRGGGALGAFGPGQMVREFETVVFGDLPVGQVSEPVQTQFGWHLILVTARPVPEASARHILVKTEKEALDLKAQIQSPADFTRLAAKHSSCPSGREGGSLGTFGPGDMVPEFDAVVFGDLPVGEVSAPVKTEFGWHLILVERR